jgi:hypothetical protein
LRIANDQGVIAQRKSGSPVSTKLDRPFTIPGDDAITSQTPNVRRFGDLGVRRGGIC